MLPPGQTSWTLFACECEYHIANGAPASEIPVATCTKHRRAA